jgi:diketogulonate reductase-like aldo/keto reductase
MKRVFGASQVSVSAIGQGSWEIERTRDSDAVAALQRGIDLGLTHIDTAEMYGAGEAERIIGKAIRGRREQVFVVSKVLPSNASRRGTIKACEQSLGHIGSDHLDCYLLHWRGRHALTETIAGFETLKKQGKIKSWGVSNFDVDDLEEVSAIAGAPTCNQVLYHLGERAIEHAVMPWCQAHDTAIIAYTPFGQSASYYDPMSAKGRVLHEIAARHGATPRQVALRFLLRHPQVFVIPKAAQLPHVEENAAALSFDLTQEDLASIDTAFARGKPPRQLPMI